MTDAGQTPRRSSQRPRSLFERLRSDDLLEVQSTADPLSARIGSIKANLVRLLNARKGGSDSAPSYGLSDFNGALLGSTDMMRAISKDIRNVITAYEPRVSHVVVSFDRNARSGAELSFQVSIQTAIHHSFEQVTIDVVLTEGRTFKVS